MTIHRLLVANRGEIAVRILRAAKELGIHTIQAVSAADKTSMAAQMADEVVEIGPAHAAKSYLNIPAIIGAMKATRADAVHPGYGFLSENAAFAEAVEAAGMIFVGPSPKTISMMGNKSEARRVAAEAGVPTVPGTQDGAVDAEAAKAYADKIGYPVLVKASAGGGGRGIRQVGQEADFDAAWSQASSEAMAAFGDGTLYVEKLVQRARHIEVQIVGDGQNVIHCYERECSIQRRRQKVWEEAPSASISDEVRERLCASAVALAKSVNYRGVGTLEYLFDKDSGEFYFIEMNTRIQVEHPTTEFITGVDLVAESIRIASGERLGYRQDDIAIRGHSIEVRLNAEDPERNFLPSPGTITALTLPGGPGVRVDTLAYPGYVLPPYYDSLLGKLIVHARDRHTAIRRLRRALGELSVSGIKTTVPLFSQLAAARAMQSCDFDTGWLERWLASDRS